MRPHQLAAGRIRWAALALSATLAAALFVLSSGAQAVAMNGQSTNVVIPTTVGRGDTVVFGVSRIPSTRLLPSANYAWSFGDGKAATGRTVEHSYGKRGNFTVTLRVTEPVGNVTTYAQQIHVLRYRSLPVPPNNPPRAWLSNAGLTAHLANAGPASGFQVGMQLMPQSLAGVLRSGIAVQVRSTAAANGIVTVFVSRDTAKQLHIKSQGPAVVIGQGTLSSLTDGSATLHLRLRLAEATASKLNSLKHVTLTVRLALVDIAGDHVVIDAAGRY